MELREYQINAIQDTLSHFKNYKHPKIAVLPTGAGKSLIIRDVLRNLPEDSKIIVLQPNKEVLVQNFNKYKKYSSDCSIYSASLNQKSLSRVVFATIGSIYKTANKFIDYRYLIIDECHLVNAKNEFGMYTDFINKNKPKIAGLTATPFRLHSKFGLDTKMLHRTQPTIFKNIYFNLSAKYLIDNGYLSKLTYKRFTQSKLDNILQVATSDYSDRSVNAYYLSQKYIMDNIINQIALEIESRNHCLIFVKTQEIQHYTARKLNELAIKTDFVNSKMGSKSRDFVIDQFKNKEIKVLVAIGICTTGFDFPELDCIVDIYPTMSVSLYIQRLGRGTRIAENKTDCLILDFANNFNRYGSLEDLTIEEDNTMKTRPLALYTKINEKKIRLTSAYIYDKFDYAV